MKQEFKDGRHLAKLSDEALALQAAKHVMGWEVKTAARKRWITTSRGERLLADVKRGEKIAEGSQVLYVDFPGYIQRIIGGTSWNPAKDLTHAWEIRLKMEQHGWTSEDRLTWMGWGDKTARPWGYHVWFNDYHLGNSIGGGFGIHDATKAPRAITIAAIATLQTAQAQRLWIENTARNAGIDVSGPKGKSDAYYLKLVEAK